MVSKEKGHKTTQGAELKACRGRRKSDCDHPHGEPVPFRVCTDPAGVELPVVP